MQIDWVHFTPWSALAGGLLIGAAAGLIAIGHGRILGASGILFGLLDGARGDRTWRVAFLAGLLLGPIVGRFALSIAPPRIDAGWSTLAVAGVLVGFGSRLGSGCTSGHGVCGLSRLSLRSLVATLTFMLAGFATVFFARHVLG
jgi:uncharacterized membrane protein YedE/YeeE